MGQMPDICKLLPKLYINAVCRVRWVRIQNMAGQTAYLSSDGSDVVELDDVEHEIPVIPWGGRVIVSGVLEHSLVT